MRDFVFGGMENTSATTMNEHILLDAKRRGDFTSDDLISHELAHMWFGDLLTCRDWSHGWLNESFATFFEFLWREEHLGRGRVPARRHRKHGAVPRRSATAARS